MLARDRRKSVISREEIKRTERQISVSKRIIAQEEEELSSEERSLLEFISQAPGMSVTQIYKALELSGYKGDKFKENLIEKGLIVQEETRKERGGRLAKILSITDKGASILKKLPLVGKEGNLHKHLQGMLKEQAELYGWKATIEERMPRSLESVDVGLRKDDVRVAIEVPFTSKAGQEIQNIRKCLEAGYDYVLSVCSDDKNLSSL